MATSSALSSTTSTRTGPARRKWFVNFHLNKNERAALASVAATSRIALTEATTSNQNLNENQLPVAFMDHDVPDSAKVDDDRLLAKRSWDIASAPFKQIPMNLFLAWMAGNSLQLMSLMIVVMLVMKPIQAIFSLRSAFASIEQESETGKIWLLKATYLLGNLTHLALALYKCQSMGLLPTYNSDWLAFAAQQSQAQLTVGGFALA